MQTGVKLAAQACTVNSNSPEIQHYVFLSSRSRLIAVLPLHACAYENSVKQYNVIQRCSQQLYPSKVSPGSQLWKLVTLDSQNKLFIIFLLKQHYIRRERHSHAIKISQQMSME